MTAQLSRDEPCHPQPEHRLGREDVLHRDLSQKTSSLPEVSHHVENQTTRRWWLHQVHLTKWDLASSQPGKETCKEKAGAPGNAACELTGDAPCLCERDLMEQKKEMA